MSKMNDAERNGRIIGFNNDSGLLYKTQMGLQQFGFTRNVIAKPGLSLDKYKNKKNEKTTLEQMNGDGNVNFYEGTKEKIYQAPDQIPTAPPEEPATGGKTQEPVKYGGSEKNKNIYRL